LYFLQNRQKRMKTKCVFLDRDGVLNKEPTDYYLYRPEEIQVPEGVIDGLRLLKAAGYLLIVITNQAGIAKGLYTREDVQKVHAGFQVLCGNLLDDLYFCPHHPDYSTSSLLRKPGSLMIEKAMAKYNISPAISWMVGDRERDIEAGQKAGVKTIYLNSHSLSDTNTLHATNFRGVTNLVLSS
jgi:D-glycero-D-manno-heptose 1,7-bisphosphate phosphatase